MKRSSIISIPPRVRNTTPRAASRVTPKAASRVTPKVTPKAAQAEIPKGKRKWDTMGVTQDCVVDVVHVVDSNNDHNNDDIVCNTRKFYRVEMVNLTKGMKIVTPSGTANIACIVRQLRQDIAVNRFGGGLNILPSHPVRITDDDGEGDWTYPHLIPKMQLFSYKSMWIYNLILDTSKTILINNVECLTIGDPMFDISALTSHVDWERGLITLE